MDDSTLLGYQKRKESFATQLPLAFFVGWFKNRHFSFLSMIPGESLSVFCVLKCFFNPYQGLGCGLKIYLL